MAEQNDHNRPVRIFSSLNSKVKSLFRFQNPQPGSLTHIFNNFFQATLNYSHDVGGGETWQADIWQQSLRRCFYAQQCSDQVCNWETFHVSSSWAIWLCKNIWQVRVVLEKSFLFKVSFLFSSSCAYDSWRLSVPENTQRSLDYWSSDWKYRCSLYISFQFEKCAPSCNFFRNDADVVAVRYNCSFTGWTSTR